MSDEVLKDTDLLAVSRDNASYQVTYSDLDQVLDTDLFAVSRDGVNYKVEAQYVNKGEPGLIGTPVDVLTPVNGAGLNDGNTYNPISSEITEVGPGSTSVFKTSTIDNVDSLSNWDQSQGWNTAVNITSWEPQNVGNGLWGTDPNHGINSHANRTGALILTFPAGYLDGKKVEFWQPSGTSERNDKLKYGFGANGSESGIPYYTGYNGWRSLGVARAGETSIYCYKNSSDTTNFFGGIRVDEKQLVLPWIEGSSYQGKLLTFPTNDGFAQLKVGDKVQTQILGDARLDTTGGSADGTPPLIHPLSEAFDGSFGTYVMLDKAGDTCFWTFTKPIKGTKFEMYGASNYSSGDGTGVIEVNGVNGCVVPGGPTPEWGDFSVMAAGEFRTLKMNRNDSTHNPYIAKFRVDGVELTDPFSQTITAIDSEARTITVNNGFWAGSDSSGDWTPSPQVWSETVTSDKPITMGSLADLFNGQANTQVGMGSGESGSSFILTFTNPITNVKKVEIGAYTYGNSQSFNNYQVNGGQVVSGIYNAYQEELVLYEGGAMTLSWIEIVASNTGVPPWIKWIRVNGILLVDEGIDNPEAPDTAVSKIVTTDATITLANDRELVNLIGPLTQVDATGKVKTPITSEIASVGNQLLTTYTVWTSNDAQYSTQLPTLTQSQYANEGTLPIGTPAAWSGTRRAVVYDAGVDGVSWGVFFYVGLGSNSPYDLWFESSDFVNWTGITMDPADGTAFSSKRYIGFQSAYSQGYNTDAPWGGATQSGTGINSTNPNTILTFNTPNPDLKYFNAGDALIPCSIVTAVNVASAEAITGDIIESKGGKYKGLHEMDGNTYNYFYGGDTGSMSFSNNGNSEYVPAQASLIDGYSNTMTVNTQYDKLLQYVKTLSTKGYGDWFVCAKNEFDKIDGFKDRSNQFFSSSNAQKSEAWGYNGGWQKIDKNREYVTPYYRKELASAPPTINLTLLTVIDPDSYPVGTKIIQPDTGATAKIRNIVGNDLGLMDVVGTFIAGYQIEIQNSSPIYVVSVDVDGNSMVVDGDAFKVGAPVIGPPLSASADEVNSVSGNSIGVTGITGTWIPSLFIKGAPISASAPSPSQIVFTSSNAGTTEFSGKDATLVSRTWTLESGDSSIGPWNLDGVYEDYSATASQDGSVNWSDHPVLEKDKFYRVKVRYNSNNAVAVESTFNTFKTGDE